MIKKARKIITPIHSLLNCGKYGPLVIIMGFVGYKNICKNDINLCCKAFYVSFCTYLTPIIDDIIDRFTVYLQGNDFKSIRCFRLEKYIHMNSRHHEVNVLKSMLMNAERDISKISKLYLHDSDDDITNYDNTYHYRSIKDKLKFLHRMEKNVMRHHDIRKTSSPLSDMIKSRDMISNKLSIAEEKEDKFDDIIQHCFKFVFDPVEYQPDLKKISHQLVTQKMDDNTQRVLYNGVHYIFNIPLFFQMNNIIANVPPLKYKNSEQIYKVACTRTLGIYLSQEERNIWGYDFNALKTKRT